MDDIKKGWQYVLDENGEQKPFAPKTTADQIEGKIPIEQIDGDIAGNLQLQIDDLQKEAPTVVLGTVSIKEATSNLYPVCKLHKITWAAGLGGAGVGPAGGTNVIEIPASFEFDGANNVIVIVPAAYKNYTNPVQISTTRYAFLSDDENDTASLFLTIL